MNNETIKKILEYQKNEITEHILYGALAKRAKGKNAAILQKISDDELKHYIFFKKITGKDVKPDRLKIIFHRIVSKIFGFTFTIKISEERERLNFSNREDQYLY